jgi:hypothetical protein
MKTKLLGCIAATAMAAAIVVATPAMAFRGGGGGGHMMGGGSHMMGGMGGHPMMGRGGGMPGGRMFTRRSMFVPGGNRFVGAPFAGRHAFVNRRFFDEGRRDRIEDRIEGRRDRFEDRFEDRFRDRRFFFNRFDNFGFFGVPFASAAYGNGCWRQTWTRYGWQWVNVCYDYGY